MSVSLWKQIQSFVGVVADGVPGNLTAQAIARKLGVEPPAEATQVLDSRSEKNIVTLVPSAQIKAREWLIKCLGAGINVKIIAGNRTYQEQSELYAQGRTKSGQKVTNAQAGYSWHNFGVAWDFVVFDAKGEPLWDSPLMKKCGEIAESLGLEWGGRWTSFPDVPHIQVKTGYTLAQARQKVAAGTWNPA